MHCNLINVLPLVHDVLQKVIKKLYQWLKALNFLFFFWGGEGGKGGVGGLVLAIKCMDMLDLIFESVNYFLSLESSCIG